VKLSADATVDATDQGRGGLDLELPLAGHDLRSEDLKAVQAQQPGG
jgi:hypothetical protein